MQFDAVRRVIERHMKTDLVWASDYGEPGYTKEHHDQPILFVNWNNIPKHVRTEDGEVVGGDLIEKPGSDQDWYIERILNTPEICPFDIDFEKLGFVKHNENEYEYGVHPGMTDNPEKILAEAMKEFPDCDFVLGQLKPSQFYSEFNLFRRKKAVEEEEESE